LQTDDTLFVGDEGFAKKEQVKLEEAKFIAKERECLAFSYDFKFNSGIVHFKDDGGSITLMQAR
jgi:hypothetical protein